MSNACRTCGEKSFSVESGVKTCNFCGTEEIGFLEVESQEILSQVDYSRLTRIKKIRDEVDSSFGEVLNNWTTYEAFNITLFEWTQALRAAGVSKDFQEIVFKLWVTYLQRMEVAFISEAEQDKNWKSKATLLETARNIQIIHNEQETIAQQAKKKKKKKKKKKYQTNLERIQDKVEKQKHKYKGKTSLNYLLGEFNKTLTELDADSTGMDDSLCPVLEEVTSKVEPKTSAVRKCQLVHNTTANRVLAKKGRETMQDNSDGQKTDELESAVDTNRRADAINMKLNRKYIQSRMPFQLNFQKLLSLLYLAVLLSEEDILLMDIIRWCREGHIPFLSAPNLFKQDMGLLEQDRYMLFSIRDVPSADIVQDISGKLALFLSIQYIPLPKEDLIMSRIVNILRLPATIGTLAKQFMESAHRRSSKYTPSIPDVETRVVAAVICAVKLCCGLDDWQEVKLSRAAKMINKQLKWSSKQVFNWDEWERYMVTLLWVCCKVNVVFATQCRKYDLTEFMTSTNICEHFWQEGIWRKAKFSSNKGHKDQDYKIMQKLLAVKGTPLEDMIDQQNVLRMSKDPFMDIVNHFLKNFENSEHEDVQDLLMVARRLQNKSFAAHDLTWPAHLKEIEEILKKSGSGLCLRPESNSDFLVFQESSKKEKLRIPQPQKCAWKCQMTPENVKLLPKSFLWLVSLGALIVETDKMKIIQHINMIDKTEQY